MNIRELVNDGYSLGASHQKLTDIALVSLKTALRAYFSTYKAMQYSIHMFTSGNRPEQEQLEYNTPPSYWEAAAETIVHFQHFIELVVKDILRKEHILLADTASKNPVVLHKLLVGEQLDANEMQSVQTLGFSDSFTDLCKLIQSNRIPQTDYNYFVDNREWILELNKLRNRIWHRGAYVLNLPALDELVGKYILPFIDQVTQIPKYDLPLWRFEALSCGIDPISEIVFAYQTEAPDLRKIAFLKELGRAAYKNPYSNASFSSFFNKPIKMRGERAAKHEIGDPNVAEVLECPVCGTKSLIVLYDIELEGEDQEAGTYEKAWYYTYSVECRMCTFEVNGHLGNPSEHGLRLPDYWKEECG